MTSKRPAPPDLPGWPRWLNGVMAAAYVGVSTSKFAEEVRAGVWPSRNSQIGRWDRLLIDRTSDRLSDGRLPVCRSTLSPREEAPVPVPTPFLHKVGNSWHWKPSKAAYRLGFTNVALGADETRANIEGAKLWQKYQAARVAAAALYEGSFRHLVDVYAGNAERGIKPSREWARLAAESQRDYRRHIDKTIIPMFGTEQVETVNAEIVGALHAKYADRPYAGNHLLRVLGTLFRCALQHPSKFKELAGVNPCDAITAFGVKEGVVSRDRVWTADEVKGFDRHIDNELLMARLLYSYTGQRTLDVLAMLDIDYEVDADGRWLHVAQHKTGKRIWIYCHAHLWPAIEAHIERHRRARPDRIGVPLIQNTLGEAFNRRVFVSRWDRCAVKAGIVTLSGEKGVRRSRENPTRHDLRRTATTLLSEAGCTEDEISSITGLSIAMIRRQVYNVRSRAHAKAGIRKLEGYGRQSPVIEAWDAPGAGSLARTS